MKTAVEALDIKPDLSHLPNAKKMSCVAKYTLCKLVCWTVKKQIFQHNRSERASLKSTVGMLNHLEPFYLIASSLESKVCLKESVLSIYGNKLRVALHATYIPHLSS